MNRSTIWKVALVVAVLVIFTAAIVPTSRNPEPIRRGLDLKGGTQLVMQVNVNEAVRLEADQAIETMKTQAARMNAPAPAFRRINDGSFAVVPPAGVAVADYERIATDYLGSFERSRGADGALVLRMSNVAIQQLRRDTVARAVETIDNRVNALGVTEPVIAPQG